MDFTILLDFIPFLLCVFIIACCCIRNEIVFNARCKAVDYLMLAGFKPLITSSDIINNGYEIMEINSSHKMFWELNKWTFAKFYPELVVNKEIKSEN